MIRPEESTLFLLVRPSWQAQPQTRLGLVAVRTKNRVRESCILEREIEREFIDQSKQTTESNLESKYFEDVKRVSKL